MRAWRMATIGVGMPSGPGSASRRPDVNAEAPMTFDLVWAFEALEHVQDDAAAIRACATRLRAGGYLPMLVPAHQRRVSVSDRLMGHWRRYDPLAMASLLTRPGFSGIGIRLYGFGLRYLLDGPRELLRKRQLADGDHALAERTCASGRVMQPSGRHIGTITQTLTAPFRMLQRGFPNLGTGLVVRARLDA